METKLKEMEVSFQEAKEEAAKWKGEYDAMASSELWSAKLSAAESKSDELERQVRQSQALLADQTVLAREANQASIDKLTLEFESSLDQNTKTVAALRQALRKTTKEKSYLQEKSSAERTQAVEDVRAKMNDEVANLKMVLKSIEGEMGEKEVQMQSALLGREETEKLMGELM